MKKYNNIITRKFQSIGELSKQLAQATVQPAFKNAVESGSYSTDKSYARWSLTDSYEQADNLLLFGDRELQAKIEDAGVSKTRIQLRQMQNRRQIYSSVVGFAPNVPNYIAGTPNSMINVRQVRVKQPVLNFMYNTTVSCSVSAEDIVRATAQLISAIMKIEASGIRMNIYAGEIFYEDAHACCFMARIKDSGQAMDTLKMSYPLAHPSMLRRQWFRLLETTPGVPDQYVSGYGTVIKTEREALDVLKQAKIQHINRCLCYSEIAGRTADEIAEMITGGAK